VSEDVKTKMPSFFFFRRWAELDGEGGLRKIMPMPPPFFFFQLMGKEVEEWAEITF